MSSKSFFNNPLQNGITYGILTSKQVCEILDSEWGKKMLHDGTKQMFSEDMKLTKKQFQKKHGLEGDWY